MMNTSTRQPVPILHAMEKLQEASSRLGMTEDDVLAILTSGITMIDMLDYVDAMLQNQTN